MVNHRAHGREIYIRHSHIAPTTTQKHYIAPPLHTTTAQPLCTHTRTRTSRERTMVKSGNIKVDLRSGAALLQERTRTRTRTRIGFYRLFRFFCVCFFRVLLFAAFMPFSDVVLPCLLTVWACFVGGWWCGVLRFHAFCKCLYLRFEPFLPKMYVFFAATDRKRRTGWFLWRLGAFQTEYIIYNTKRTVLV